MGPLMSFSKLICKSKSCGASLKIHWIRFKLILFFITFKALLIIGYTLQHTEGFDILSNFALRKYVAFSIFFVPFVISQSPVRLIATGQFYGLWNTTEEHILSVSTNDPTFSSLIRPQHRNVRLCASIGFLYCLLMDQFFLQFNHAHSQDRV